MPELPIEELPIWETISNPDPQHVVHWDSEVRSARFRLWSKTIGLGSGVSIPMTTPHRRLGTLGIGRSTMDPFNEEDVAFLRLIARVVAFALDDGLNLRRAPGCATSFAETEQRLQFEEIMRALAESRGRVGGADGAAALIGINRTTLIS